MKEELPPTWRPAGCCADATALLLYSSAEPLHARAGERQAQGRQLQRLQLMLKKELAPGPEARRVFFQEGISTTP